MLYILVIALNYTLYTKAINLGTKTYKYINMLVLCGFQEFSSIYYLALIFLLLHQLIFYLIYQTIFEKFQL